ncbi:hypothetical protein, partial [Streptomyces narbonensis]|uniref:hypothetical protein n=1 Tax=Streptomyces narbonensis TaxID=67333 RepID=UPI0033E01FF0
LTRLDADSSYAGDILPGLLLVGLGLGLAYGPPLSVVVLLRQRRRFPGRYAPRVGTRLGSGGLSRSCSGQLPSA